MNRIIFLFWLYGLSFSYWQPTLCTFNTIDEARTYIDAIEEYPDVQMRDWSNPDYTPYYKQIRAGFFSRLFEKTGIYKPVFSPFQAKKLLKNITRNRELDGLVGRFIQKITPVQGEKILIFGDLCGAVHSFVRDLEYLKTINVLSNDFKLKQGYYIIINGNVADKSHHLLELLAIVIRLLQENPKTVFYVRGTPENKEGWLGKTLEYELVVRAPYLPNGRVPLEMEVDRFFNTLPLAVFATMAVDDKVQCIRFSPEGFSDKELRSELIDVFLQNEIKQSQYKLNETLVSDKKREKKVDLVALFRLEDRGKTYRKNKGIVRLDDEEGTPAFATISGPVETNRRLYDFFYDAFLQVSVSTDLASSSLTLFFRDVREMIGFQQETVPFVAKASALPEPKAGQEVSKEEKKEEKGEAKKEPVEKSEAEASSTDSSKSKKSIQLGCTLDLTRGLLRVGGQHRRGIEVAAKRYEQSEGMDIQITFLDDQYTPEMARSNVEILLSKNIDILLGPTGSPTTESYLDLIKAKRVLVLFPVTGASLFRNPQIPYIINFRASYETEAQILLHEAINTHHANKVVLFYQDDSFGHAALSGIEEYEKLMHVPSDFIVKVPYERNNVNLTAQADVIKKANAQVIILVTVVSAARELLRLFDISFFSGKFVLGVSDLSERTFINFSKEKGINIQTLSVTPSPLNDLEIAKRFREDAAAQRLELDTFAFEGYIDATICFDALKKIKGEKATKEAMIDVITSYKNYDLFGLNLTFNPEKQDLSQGTWWVSGEREWPVAKIPELAVPKQPQKPKQELQPQQEKQIPEKKPELESKQDKQVAEKKVEPQPKEDKKIPEKKLEPELKQDKQVAEKKAEPKPAEDKQIPEKKPEPKQDTQTAEKKVEPQSKEDKKIPEKKVESGQAQKQVRVGCSMDLSRGLRISNEQQQEGMKMALSRFEKDLPVSVQIVFLDDQYSPAIALENAKKFLDQGIDIILGSSGSPTTQSFIDLSKEGKLLVLFPTSGAPIIRNSEYRYMLHFRPCFCTEAKAMIREAITAQGAKNIVVFYQDDSFGRGALAGIEEYEKENDMKQIVLTKIPYNRNDVNFTQQAEQIKKLSPDTFILLSTAIATRELIRLVDISFFYQRKMFGISDLSEEAFLKFMKEKGLTITVTNVMPNINATIEIAKMFRADAEKNKYPADVIAFEGYVIAALFCDILKHVDLSKNLKDEIVRVVESYKQQPFFGLTLTFNPAMRDLSQPVWLFDGTTWKEIPAT